MGEPRVVVVGASGFVGSAVTKALRARGASVVTVAAPRLSARVGQVESVVREADLTALASLVDGAQVVVNAAGVADATSSSELQLFGANAALPGILARACQRSGVRFIQVSSAAVQGRRPLLDASDDVHPTTVYGRSKHLGEVMAREHHTATVIYRPAGVHGAGRQVTRSLRAVARSPLSSVASPGTDNAPHALIEDVADAIAFLALHADTPPGVVTHPSSGLTTAQVLEFTGEGRHPLLIPRVLAWGLVRVLTWVGRLHSAIGANARRLEVMWFGQAQDHSWLETAGWTPVTTPDQWRLLPTGGAVVSPCTKRGSS